MATAPSVGGGRKIKLKLKGVPAAAAAATAAAAAAAACGRAANGPSTSQQPAGTIRERATWAREQLKDYVPPSASPESIVAAILRGGVPAMLGTWSSMDGLALPKAVRDVERPAKRQRQDGAVDASCNERTAAAATADEGPAPKPAPQTQEGAKPGQKRGREQACDAPGSIKSLEVALPEGGAAAVAPGSASSSAEAASHFQFPSPEDGEGIAHRAAAPAVPAATQGPLPLPQRRSDGAAPGPSSEWQQGHQRRHTGNSVAVQAGRGPVVPLSLYELGSFSSSLPQVFYSITPFDLHLPALAVRPAHEVTNQFVLEVTAAAQQLKRKADQLKAADRHQAGRWSLQSLSYYVEAAIKYMEACEYMLMLPHGPDRLDERQCRERAATLYGATSELLAFSIEALQHQSVRGGELGKEALRLLIERLCAVCCLREQQQRPSSSEPLASNLQKQYQQQQQQQQVQPKGGTGTISSSPDGSTTSRGGAGVGGVPAATAAAGRSVHSSMPPPQRPPQHHPSLTPDLLAQHNRVMAAGRHLLRFAETLARSTLGFQEFIERQDVQCSQEAKLACMHMATVCVDLGVRGGFALMGHASRALAHIRHL